jgi:hypothetical protein
LSAEANGEQAHEVWVVDRVEDGVAILVEDEGEIVAEVALTILGSAAVEGAVLVVPLGSIGEPVWSEARRDPELEAERLGEAEEVVERLRSRDPGGDVEI